ncbi:MAG: putative secreted protein [Rhodocyclales bacterium]|nr:putative secreted protein [Rhodocyclales bacterium]
MLKRNVMMVSIVAIGMMTSASLFAATLSHGDKKFLDAAAHAGHTEVEGSKLAQSKSSSSDVKSFADQMIKDHTKVGDELDQLAASKGVKVPTEPSITQKAKLKMLGAYSGANFDKHYAKSIGVEAHEDTVKLFRKASKDVKDPDVKAFADKTLPGLEHHLEMAKTLASTTASAK